MPFLLHNSYLFWISRLAASMQERFNKELQHLEVSWPQWMVMNVLNHNLANTPAHIAEQMGVDRSAVTRLVDRLENKGLVQRMHDGLDRRSVQIHLTKAGQSLARQLDAAAERHQQLSLSELPETECENLKAHLVTLLRTGGIDSASLWEQA